MQLSPGFRIRDYEVVKLLGAGGMGEVYLARDVMLDREVAIKRLNAGLTGEGDFALRFQNEARIQAKLNHHNIVTLHSFFEEQGIFYMVMEHAPGITLRQLIDRTGPIPEERTLRIFNQLAAALAYAHGKGIVHRDVKPSNIMVNPDHNDAVKVMDFGIARLLGDGHLTRTGTRLGTVNYMSPEQVMGLKDIDQRSDIYSAGVVLYEMLSGKLPYDADTDSEYQIQHKIVTESVPDPRQVYPYISDSSVNLLQSCTAKDRDKRISAFDTNNSGSSSARHPDIAVSVQSRNPRIPSPVVGISGTELILVEGGTFLMGSNEGENDEKPVHEVSLSSFQIGKYPVTQKEWQDLMGSNPSGIKGYGLPVVNVSWYDAVDYCNKLSELVGLTPCYAKHASKKLFSKSENIAVDWNSTGYRLPTEAEWEFAVRGGKLSKGYKYSGSNDLKSVAWFSGNAGNRLHAIGTKKPNELGIHDMTGNVWEWCWDVYSAKYYRINPVSNPKGPDSGSYRLMRGGSWGHNAAFCCVSYRNYGAPYGSDNDCGFRLCRAVI